jgi:DNA-binding beta-propeller fold protein YncE
MATTKRWKRHDSTAWRGGRLRRRRRGIAWLRLPKGPLSRALFLLAVIVFGAFAAWYLLGRGGERFAVLGIARGAAGPAYQSSIADVARPLAVATSPDGRLIYAGESDGRYAVRIFDRQGRDVGTIEAPKSLDYWLPINIAVARTGEVYVVDGMTGGIHVFSPEGEFLRTMPPPEGLDAWSPTAVAFDDVGNLYVTERFESPSEARHRVLVFSPGGDLLRQFGKKGTGLGELNYPSGIVVDEQGRIYVTNMAGGIDVFTAEGRYITRLGALQADKGVGLPRGLALDQDQRLYVVDITGQQVAVYDTASEGFPLLYSFGSFGQGDGEFRFPESVAVDATGRVYVADRVNNRVEIWS